MKRLLQATTLLLAGGLTVPAAALMHGGRYNGPGDTVPGGAGGSGGSGAGPAPGPAPPPGPLPGTTGPGPQPGPTGPTSGGPAQDHPVTAPRIDLGVDLTAWSFWWEFNKAPYLSLKGHVHTGIDYTGTPGFYLGQGSRQSREVVLRPTERDIREVIVPALQSALESDDDQDIATGCMIALARIGEPLTEGGESVFADLFEGHLGARNQEVSETAALALGILADPRSIETLVDLLEGGPAGVRWVGRGEVPLRTQAFAAYGLGLVGAAPTTTAEQRSLIVERLAESLLSSTASQRDVEVACVVSLGLVPLPFESSAPDPEAGILAGRLSQARLLLDYLEDEERRSLVRAHCPTALVRLFSGIEIEEVPVDAREPLEALLSEVRSTLAEAVGPRARADREIVQSAILALAHLGLDGEGQDPIQTALLAAPKHVKDQAARYFSLIASAQREGDLGPREASRETTRHLLSALAEGKGSERAWAGLSIGVLLRAARQSGSATSGLTDLSTALREALRTEKNPSRLGALAIACGLASDVEAEPILLEHFARERDEEARGYVALGLGLLQAANAREPIQKLVRDSKYRPELLHQAATALALLGDKSVVPLLTEMLAGSDSLATQAAVSSALGAIGDRRAIDPLVELLLDPDQRPLSRAFAAVALGIVADKEPVPWNSKIGVDLNYLAATGTLTNAADKSGILDLY